MATQPTTATPTPPSVTPEVVESQAITIRQVPETEKQEMESNAKRMLQNVQSLVIATPEEYESAGTLTSDIVRKREEIKARLKVQIADPIYQSWQRALDLYKEVDAPYAQAEAILSNKLKSWKTEWDRKKREAEAALRAKQEQINRTQQARVLAVELAKFELDEAKLAEMIGTSFDEVNEGGLSTLRNLLTTKTREAAEARAKADQDERFLQEAIRREEEGDKETANLILDAAIELPPPEVSVPVPVAVAAAPTISPIIPEAPKLNNIGFRTVWKWRLVNMDQVPPAYKIVSLDERTITSRVNALKDKTDIPGIEVYSEQEPTKKRKF